MPTVDAEDVAWAHEQLAARAKGELRPTAAGVVPVHAAWSSTALVCSAFAFWRRRPAALALPGLGGGFDELRLEERLHIPHGGGTPNLDVVLRRGGELVGIESKLTEHLTPRPPRAWKPAYHRPAMAAELEGGWADVFADLLTGRWAPRYLDAGQLVRHALSLRRRHRLVYLHWAPAPDEHDAELAELVARVGGSAPRLHALTWPQVWDAWADAEPAHAAALRARYAL